ncbi:hypothetical protein CROQUDRAFT_654869 [Cronartium quercuum f. sp. fusiforme G11]|uniref:Uncharacterized protein n=1 Tax=Cronartium quercuum f. sp. fusiforme G11 TaxID=708437 RepID=A0A9P6TE47_9BASI|nr:hypothetical protein CROQUDRAFT_654869 [Cronartium quercuum f. sp. fusiforme G11]
MWLYTEDILPRHGSRLQSMKATLLKECHVPGPIDNLLRLSPSVNHQPDPLESYGDISDLPMKTVADTLRHCPNLRTLILQYPEELFFEGPGDLGPQRQAKCFSLFKDQSIGLTPL